jgi:hypothetical protein
VRGRAQAWCHTQESESGEEEEAGCRQYRGVAVRPRLDPCRNSSTLHADIKVALEFTGPVSNSVRYFTTVNGFLTGVINKYKLTDY